MPVVTLPRSGSRYHLAMDKAGKQAIIEAWERAKGVADIVAADLGITRRQLYREAGRLGILNDLQKMRGSDVLVIAGKSSNSSTLRENASNAMTSLSH